ncbi:hypothetical protein EVAR_14362_1 [Eumeta japonica]|uniref:Uncharacterized protein n=1 Tax=Eumeta variegata TaxID=151549 RepID=A0A4C1TX38_EUMVA|nr:hypothetical protein EVAR_14362_1 [Eumeta japonica]
MLAFRLRIRVDVEHAPSSFILNDFAVNPNLVSGLVPVLFPILISVTLLVLTPVLHKFRPHSPVAFSLLPVFQEVEHVVITRSNVSMDLNLEHFSWLHDEAPSLATVYNELTSFNGFNEFTRGRANLTDDLREGRPYTTTTAEKFNAERLMIETDKKSDLPADLLIGIA